jgi:hypothetical protein
MITSQWLYGRILRQAECGQTHYYPQPQREMPHKTILA